MEMIENLYQILKVYGNNMKMVGNLWKLYGNNMETVETPCHFSSSSIQYTAKMDSICNSYEIYMKSTWNQNKTQQEAEANA